MPISNGFVHVIAGGAGGTAGAIVTCPLEVVKTRLQSSSSNLYPVIAKQLSNNVRHMTTMSASIQPRPSLSILMCLKSIYYHEGFTSLFRGLGPTLMGVTPSRAIYFGAYAKAKSFFSQILPPETAWVHMSSAGCAGFATCTVTNPIWLIKTRMQLDHRNSRSGQGGGTMGTLACIRKVYGTEGLRGFWRGVTASYAGISETMIHFVIYEGLKQRLDQNRWKGDPKTALDFLTYMGCAATSKTCATFIAYPHEVVRTRLREEGNKYHAFFQTLGTVAREEGVGALYRGLVTQLVRQIPNTAILMVTYELVLYSLSPTIK